MRKVEVNVYKYEDLDKEIQEKLLDKEIEEQLECYCEDCLYDDMQFEGVNLLADMFDVDYDKASEMKKQVYYDLSYSQGSGAMIEFTIDIDTFNKKYKIYNEEEMRLIKDKDMLYNIRVFHNDNFYYHEYSFGIDYNDNFGYWDYEDIKDDYNVSEDAFNSLHDRLIKLCDTYNKHNTDSKFIEDIITMNRGLKNTGYNMIEDKESFKDIALEYLNEREYTKTGEVYYESNF